MLVIHIKCVKTITSNLSQCISLQIYKQYANENWDKCTNFSGLQCTILILKITPFMSNSMDTLASVMT